MRWSLIGGVRAVARCWTKLWRRIADIYTHHTASVLATYIGINPGLICTSSTSAFASLPAHAADAASKPATYPSSRGLAPFPRRGIRCNAVAASPSSEDLTRPDATAQPVVRHRCLKRGNVMECIPTRCSSPRLKRIATSYLHEVRRGVSFRSGDIRCRRNSAII